MVNMSLQKGTQFVAAIDIIVAVLSLSLSTFIIIIGCFPNLSDDTSIREILHDERTAVKIGVNIFVLSLILLSLSFVLYEGARKMDFVRCIVWIGVKGVFLLIATTSTIMNTIYNPKLEQGIAAVGIVLTTICILVVYRFIQELKHQGDESFKPKHNYTVNKV